MIRSPGFPIPRVKAITGTPNPLLVIYTVHISPACRRNALIGIRVVVRTFVSVVNARRPHVVREGKVKHLATRLDVAAQAPADLYGDGPALAVGAVGVRVRAFGEDYGRRAVFAVMRGVGRTVGDEVEVAAEEVRRMACEVCC